MLRIAIVEDEATEREQLYTIFIGRSLLESMIAH